MKSGIGAAHALGHTIFCQLNLSVRTILGLGTSDGEQNERVQSLLIGYIRQLKYSTPLNFRRFLRHILDFVNSEKVVRIYSALRKRLNDARDWMGTSSAKVFDLWAELRSSGVLEIEDTTRVQDALTLNEICSSCTDNMHRLQVLRKYFYQLV